MRSTELRIGNYVNTPNGMKRVSTISVDGWSMHTESEPIPITEEYILRFGFDSLGKYGYAKGDFKLEFTSNIITTQDCIFVLWVNSRIIRIKSIHQLQNLYHALTGTELILK